MDWEKNKYYTKKVKLIENENYSFFSKKTGVIDNLLIHGDNILVLKELKKTHKKIIKCVYFDPPYNTGKNFSYGKDDIDHADWLSLMHQRLLSVKELMRTDGFIFFQIDNNELHYLKLVMDEVFGRENYRNSFIIKKSPKKTLFQEDNKKLNMAYHTLLMYSIDSNTTLPMFQENEVMKEDWLDIFAGGNLTSFVHETNEEVLYRIFSLVTDKEDIILDAFLGSGTACAVAHKMRRRWIGIEKGVQIYEHAFPRIKQVVLGNDKSIITEKTGWDAGGGFRFFETIV